MAPPLSLRLSADFPRRPPAERLLRRAAYHGLPRFVPRVDLRRVRRDDRRILADWVRRGVT